MIVLLIFGARRLPEIGKGLGGAIREFKKIKKEIGSDRSDHKRENNNRTPAKEDTPSTQEAKMAEKVLEQVPGAKKAVEVKKKAEKIKEIIK